MLFSNSGDLLMVNLDYSNRGPYWVLGVVLFIYGVLAAFVIFRVFSPVVYVAVSVFVAIFFLVASSRGQSELYVRIYFSYALVSWVVVSLIRRLGDTVWGWSELNIYSVSPVFIGFLSVFFISSRVLRYQRLLFLCALILLVQTYGFFVGVWNVGLFASAYSYLTWLVPVFFLMYLVSNSCWVEKYIEDLYVLSVVVVLFTSCYGLMQYFILPLWDLIWIANVPMTSVGAPMPMQFRLFSTMHSPMVYAPVLAMLMLYILSRKSLWSFGVLAVGVLALSLTYVRAAWLIFAMGLLMYFIWLSRADLKFGIRVLVSIFISLVIFFLVVVGTDFGVSILERVNTMVNLTDDTSYNERVKFYADMFGYALSNLVGDGLGAVGRAQTLAHGQNIDTVFDSGILQIFVVFGLILGLLYFFLTFLMTKPLVKTLFLGRSEYVISSIIVVVMLFQMIFSNRLIGPVGFFVYVFWAISLAGYYRDREAVN